MSLAWSVLGNRQSLDGGAMYGNAPRAMWEKWSPPDERHRISLACRALLVREDDRWILLETGAGDCYPPELRDRFGMDQDGHVLLDGLATLGLTDADIDVVVLSHLHFDHAGGLLSRYAEGPPRLLFPRARYVVGTRAWERAIHPHSRDRASFLPVLNGLLAESGRLTLVDGDTHPLLPGWRFHHSDGHTPGLLLAEVPGKDGPVVFAADLIPGVPWVHLPITMGYDRFPERVIDEKEALLSDLLGRGGRIFFTHDPRVALATVHRDEKGRFGTAEERTELVAVTL